MKTAQPVLAAVLPSESRDGGELRIEAGDMYHGLTYLLRNKIMDCRKSQRRGKFPCL
jgi:hypothetical protein